MNNFLGHLGMALVLVLILFGDSIVDWLDPGRIDRRIAHNQLEQVDYDKDRARARAQIEACIKDNSCLGMLDNVCYEYALSLESWPEAKDPMEQPLSQQHWREYNARHPKATDVNSNIWQRICPDDQNWSPKHQECR